MSQQQKDPVTLITAALAAIAAGFNYLTERSKARRAKKEETSTKKEETYVETSPAPPTT